MNATIRFLLLTAILCIHLPVAAADFDHSHALLDKVLKSFVRDARVDYAALQKNSDDLDAYLDQAASVTEAEFKRWPQPQQLAFLINLYNAGTLRLVADHYPVASIKKIGGLFSGPWDQEVVRLFGGVVSLGHIEHEILRKQYREPRIHFAIVCAARGCPPLRSEVYTAEKLKVQLDEQGRIFLGDATRNRVDGKARTLHLSPVFKWFKADFEQGGGSVQKFVQPLFPKTAQAELAQGAFRIRYTDYDWSLNDTKAPR